MVAKYGDDPVIDTKQPKTRSKPMTVTTEPNKKAKAPAPTNSQAPAPAQARGRLKKEDAPYTIVFVGADGKESTRVPTGVTTMNVKTFDGKVRAISLSEIPQAVRDQLAADGLRKKANFFLKDVTSKADVGKVQTLTDELVKVATDGTLYVSKEGGGPGRAFDFDFWVAVMSRTADLRIKAGNTKVKPMSDAVKADFRLKLESMTPKEREEKKKKWFQDRVFKNAALQVRAERSKLTKEEVVSEEHDALADMF